MRRTALRRSTKRMRRTPLRKVSNKRLTGLALYYVLRATFLSNNPQCAMCQKWDDLDLHHRRGRGKYLNDVSTFVPLCRKCHNKVHSRPKWARANGWLISKFK